MHHHDNIINNHYHHKRHLTVIIINGKSSSSIIAPLHDTELTATTFYRAMLLRKARLSQKSITPVSP